MGATSQWDVIILGAGPAGLALARHLSTQKVLLLERQVAPSSAPRIGESLPGAASVLLQKLGLLERFRAAGHLERGATVAIWDEELPVWRDSLRDPFGPGWHLHRVGFEQMLRVAALESGAEIIFNCRTIQLQRSDGGWSILAEHQEQKLSNQYFAPIVVDATGRSASFARQLGIAHLRDDPLLCMHAFLVSPGSDEDSTTRIVADTDGWWYTVRTSGGMRVLAFHLDAQNPKRKKMKQADFFLQQALARPFLKEVLSQAAAASVHTRPAGTAILDIAKLGQAGSGFIAIGDAAVTFDPLSSQGLFNALASAESAANAIQAGFPQVPAALKRFQDEFVAVSTQYLINLHRSYRGPRRFAHEAFWATRS